MATIAVAAILCRAGNDLITSCVDNACSDGTYTICYDATANLKTAIDADYSAYGYFFAADNTATVYNNDTRGAGAAYEYAKGIPVFFGKQSVLGNIGYLITGASGYSTDISTNSLSSYEINSYSHDIAVAWTAAPYGRMAHTIINAIEGTSLPGTVPAYVHTYVNVANAFNAVTSGTDTSGWVSKAQIIDGIGGGTPTYVYVAFTHDDYALHQWAVPLDTNNAAVSALHSYINTTLGCPSGNDWLDFLDDHGYGAP
jgi:molybdate transport system substrate-binding protein